MNAYMLECCKYHSGSKRVNPSLRRMFGPFTSFDSAHEAMQQLVAKRWDDVIVHPLILFETAGNAINPSPPPANSPSANSESEEAHD